MNSDQVTQKILSNSYTKGDIARRLRFLRQYLETCFFKPDETDMTKFLLSEHATTDDIDAFISWGKTFFDGFTKENAYKIIEDIEKYIKTMPMISLYIPYEPVPAELVKLGKWFRANVRETILIDMKIDPTLLGGCAFVWQGNYRDYSLRYYMEKKRDEITKLVESYVEKFYNVS
jgi:hypothetical protein